MEALDEVHEDDLEPQHSQCDLSKDQVGVAWAKKIWAPALNQTGSWKVNSNPLLEHLWGDNHFDSLVAGKGLWVGRQAGGVPAVVAGELSGQVGGGLSRERAQVKIDFRVKTLSIDALTTPYVIGCKIQQTK